MKKKDTRILLVDDEPDILEIVGYNLSSEGYQVITAENGMEAIEQAKKHKPHLIILDVMMPKMDGITVTKKIKKEHPDIKVLAFTMFDQAEAISQMLSAGASGYILKNSPLNEVLNALRSVYKGENYYDANIKVDSKTNSNSKQKGLLTRRQKEILSLIAQGKTSREIADELFIGIHTVDTHRKNMIRILGLKGKGELMRYALEKKYMF